MKWGPRMTRLAAHPVCCLYLAASSTWILVYSSSPVSLDIVQGYSHVSLAQPITCEHGIDEPFQVVSSPFSAHRILSVRQIFSSALSLPQKLIKRVYGSAGSWNESSAAQVGHIPNFELQAPDR